MKVIGKCSKCGKTIGIDAFGVEYEFYTNMFGIPVWRSHRCKYGGD